MNFQDAEFTAALERLARLVRRRRATLGRAAGTNRGVRRGHSPEFTDYRAYQPGDDLRHLDWNLLRRFGKPFTKLFLEEEEAHVQLLLDCSASMSGKFRRLLQIVALTGAAVLEAGNRLEVLVCPPPSPETAVRHGALVQRSPLWKGRSHCPPFFAFLSQLNACGAASPATLCENAHSFRILGTGIRMLFSDFLTEADWPACFRRLMGRWQDLAAFQLLSSEEETPAEPGRCLLRDFETGNVLSCCPQELLPAYVQALHTLRERLRLGARQCGAVFSPLPAEHTLAQTVRLILRQARLLPT